MAVLNAADRQALWADLMREVSSIREPCSITKIDLRAAIDAADAWADANATSYNTAIPQPARTALSARAKARILMYVLRRRFEIS